MINILLYNLNSKLSRFYNLFYSIFNDLLPKIFINQTCAT